MLNGVDFELISYTLEVYLNAEGAMVLSDLSINIDEKG